MTLPWKIRGSVEESALKAARSQVGKAADLLDTMAADHVHETIHQVRKRLKKARALLELTRDVLGKKLVAKVDRRLRDASRPLSSVRDASALLIAFERLQERSADLVSPESFPGARAVLEANQHDLTSDFLLDGKATAQVLKAIRSAARRLSRWEFDESREGSRSSLGRAYRRGRKAFWKARATPSVDNLHDLRKRVKALRFQCKVLGENHSKPMVRLQLLCKRLADELGEGHDLALLREFLEPIESAASLLVLLDRRQIDLRQGALQRAGVVFQARSKAFARSLRPRPPEVIEA